MTQRGLAERFWEKVDKTPGFGPEGECWRWTAATWESASGSRYGAIWVLGAHRGAHVVSYELLNGPVPKGLVVRHGCHTTLCVNPEHLSVGTNQDNMQDAVRAGRMVHGERHHNAKLTTLEVLRIRELGATCSQRKMARDFGVSRSAIWQVLHGVTRRAG